MNDWTDHAACRGMDTEIFYRHEDHANPTSTHQSRSTAWKAASQHRAAAEAMATCHGCKVRRICLDAALREPGTQHGIRGGTYAKERTALVQAAGFKPSDEIPDDIRPHAIPGTHITLNPRNSRD